MSVASGYHQFLDSAAAGLAQIGAEPILRPGSDGPAWATGWQQLILDSSPGDATLYAFTETGDPSVLRERLDRLAGGLDRSGLLFHGPLSLIAVVTTPAGGGSSRSLAGLAPSTYYSNLRPHVWEVSIPGGTIRGAGRVRRGAGYDAVRSAATGEQAVAADIGDALRTHAERRNDFYRLMRGRQPLATYALIAINVIVFALAYQPGGVETAGRLRDFGALVPALVENGQWWRLFTSMFLHASIPHILFNMTSLFVVGTLAERLYGTGRFIAIYLGGGLVGSLVSFGYAVATGQTHEVAVGASGAIFGVAGALITMRFQRSDVIPQRLRDQISGFMVVLVLLNLAIGAVTPFVANSAHLGGLVGGMALSFLFPLVRSVREPGTGSLIEW